MGLSSTVVNVAGRPTEVLDGGSGEPLVFLHGGSMIGGVDFMDALTDRFHVYIPFLPGYGGTEIEPFLESRDDTVEHLTNVLDTLGLDRFVLVGHSLGGWRAAAFAARWPDRIIRLVIAAPPGMNVPGHPVTNMLALTPVERLGILTYDESIKSRWMPNGPDEAYMTARRLEQESMAHFSPGPVDPSLPELARSIKSETLLIWGDGDLLIPHQHLAAWQEAIPQATIRTFPGAGHIVFNERPEAVEALADSERSAAP